MPCNIRSLERFPKGIEVYAQTSQHDDAESPTPNKHRRNSSVSGLNAKQERSGVISGERSENEKSPVQTTDLN
jgi:hypothetical protein